MNIRVLLRNPETMRPARPIQTLLQTNTHPNGSITPQIHGLDLDRCLMKLEAWWLWALCGVAGCIKRLPFGSAAIRTCTKFGWVVHVEWCMSRRHSTHPCGTPRPMVLDSSNLWLWQSVNRRTALKAELYPTNRMLTQGPPGENRMQKEWRITSVTHLWPNRQRSRTLVRWGLVICQECQGFKMAYSFSLSRPVVIQTARVGFLRNNWLDSSLVLLLYKETNNCQ